MVLFIVTELKAVLRELKSADCWIGVLEVLNVVLAGHLILCYLEDWIADSGEEALLLVENLRGTGQSVAGESSFSLTDVFPHLKVRVDAGLLDNYHLLDVKYKQAVAILILSILINEWNELDDSLHIIECFERNVHIIMLRLLLEVDQLFEGHISAEIIHNLFLGSLE